MKQRMTLSAAKAVLADQIKWLGGARVGHRQNDALTSTMYSIALVLEAVIDSIEAESSEG